jgi:penicillin-binding protein-related factor A (putative recombinase)
MKNTGKPTEALFEGSITALGKEGYFYRIKDAAAIRGITGKVGAGIDATPSDYICAVKGQTFFCEVKSTQHETLFEFKMFRKGQNSHATRIMTAGGNYLVVIHRTLTDEWYLAGKSVFTAHEVATGRKSMAWTDMEIFRCITELTPAGRRPKW